MIDKIPECSKIVFRLVKNRKRFPTRREIAAALKMPEERIRVIAPDVGGGFGVKGHVYPEDILIAYLAKRLCRPIKWLEDRHEHFLNSAHSRDNHFDIEVGFNNDGRIVALKNSFLIDSGAYSPVGAAIAGNSIVHTLGPYDIDHYEAYCKLMLTNRTPNAPYRGAGRPEVAFVMERGVDLVANELDLDPADVRLKNMIQKTITYKCQGCGSTNIVKDGTNCYGNAQFFPRETHCCAEKETGDTARSG